MKLLKMTPENLLRHIDAYRKIQLDCDRGRLQIYTTRDEIKGRIGELFRIEGLKNPFVLEWHNTHSTFDLDAICEMCFIKEGFNSPEEMKKELRTIYPYSDVFYIHHFRECFDE